MTRLQWHESGQRIYQAGADRGVFYPLRGPGVPWNGLISVTETPVDGTSTATYEGGVRRSNYTSKKEFGASLEAFTYPDEFGAAEGYAEVFDGLEADEQTPHAFNLTYRTLVGNDVDGIDHGYKIHLVYNATATPSQKAFNTLNETPEASTFSWDISTIPEIIPGYAPTSHLVVDSRDAPPEVLQALEDILYGTRTRNARMPSLSEVIDLFGDLTDLIVIDHGDGTYTAEGPTVRLRLQDRFTITHHRVQLGDNGEFTILEE